MVRLFLTSVFLFCISFNSFTQTTHTINIIGFSFSPDNVTIEIGDTVFFNGNSDHPILEVSMDTWDTNDDIPLNGGFSFPSGIDKIKFTEPGTYYYICENHVSSGMKGKINVSATTSNNTIYTNDISIYPNPLKGNYLTLVLPKLNADFLKVNVYDLTGKAKIKEILKYTEEAIIDCSGLVSGIYIVQFEANKTNYTTRFIKN